MVPSNQPKPRPYSTSVPDFHTALQSSTRILALLGAGLSASSGLPTFRGAGGLWRTHSSVALATPEAFARNPGLVWQFYNYRRHMALSVEPNPAHHALAALARKMPHFVTLSQNVDGLSQRAQHPPEQLKLLHGTLFELKCSDERRCGYRETNFTDPVVPALAIPTSGEDPTTNAALASATSQNPQDLDISDAATPLPALSTHDLPHCPSCHRALLRPGVVWFGEQLPSDVLASVDAYIYADARPIDIILVIGTSAKVYPAAGYIDIARQRGARVCVVNMEEGDAPAGGWRAGDWVFKGDAAEIVPRLLEPVVGRVEGAR